MEIEENNFKESITSLNFSHLFFFGKTLFQTKINFLKWNMIR